MTLCEFTQTTAGIDQVTELQLPNHTKTGAAYVQVVPSRDGLPAGSRDHSGSWPLSNASQHGKSGIPLARRQLYEPGSSPSLAQLHPGFATKQSFAGALLVHPDSMHAVS